MDSNTVSDNIFPVYVEGAKKQFSEEEIRSANQAAHYLFYELGANVIPANPKVKGIGTASIAILKSWLMYKEESIPTEVFTRWQELGLFAYGIAIICGKVWRGNNTGLYLNMIDADNELAIREICTYEGKTVTIQKFATWTLVEQHSGNTNKAHFYVLSRAPFPVKASDAGKEGLGNRIKTNEIPGIEIKSIGGLSFTANSMHKDGTRYEFLNKINPLLNDGFYKHIGEICSRHGLEYLAKDGTSAVGDIPIEQLFDENTVIYEGNNRHKQLLRSCDSLIQRLKDVVPTDLIQQFAWLENKRLCKPPLDILEFNKIWKQALGFISKKSSEEEALTEEINSLCEGQNQNQHDNPSNEDSTATATATEELEQEPELTLEEIRINELLKRKLTDENIEFILTTITKEAAHDRLSIEQLFYGCCSAFTKKIIHHIVNSKESGSGKNYLLSLVSDYIPRRFVTPLSGISAKALFHKKGVLVVQNKDTGEFTPLIKITEPIEKELEEIQKKISEAKYADGKRDKKLISKLKQMEDSRLTRIKELEDSANKLIDLENTIINCQDTPSPEVYNALMSVLSQDGGDRELEYSFVDKDSSGRIGTTENILKGTPCLNTCQTIDDTNTLRHAEKNRRFVNVNPETTPNKINAAKDLMAYQAGYLPIEYDKLVVPREHKRLAKELTEIIIVKLMKHTKTLAAKEYGTKIPYGLSITNAIPGNRVWGMTITDRLQKYLSIITKETNQVFPIATFADLKKTFGLMKVAAMGVRPYVVNWYNKVFLPLYKEKKGKPVESKDEYDNIIVTENFAGVTTSELSDKSLVVFGQKLSSKEILEKYLYPLINQGVIDVQNSEYDARKGIYFPLDEGNIFSVLDDSDNKIRLKIRNNERFPTKTFLKNQFGTLSIYSPDDTPENKKNILSEKRFRILDVDDSEISLETLIDNYFNNPEDYFKESDSSNNGGTGNNE